MNLLCDIRTRDMRRTMLTNRDYDDFVFSCGKRSAAEIRRMEKTPPSRRHRHGPENNDDSQRSLTIDGESDDTEIDDDEIDDDEERSLFGDTNDKDDTYITYKHGR